MGRVHGPNLVHICHVSSALPVQKSRAPMAEEHTNSRSTSSTTEKEEVKSPNVLERAKDEFGAVFHAGKHEKETHGTSDDIDESTPIDEVKGPGVFQRVKEEIEALAEAVNPKK